MTFLNIQDVDRTVFELVRRELVRLGYIPDILLPNYEQNVLALQQSLAGGIINVFGVGSWQSRGNLSGNRFVLDRVSVEKGRIGFGTLKEVKEIIDGQETYKVYKLPQYARDIVYELRFTTLYNNYQEIADHLVGRAFPESNYTKCLSQRQGTEGIDILICVDNSYDNSNQDFYERVYTITAKDLVLEQYVYEAKSVSNGVAYDFVPVTEIISTVKPKVVNDDNANLAELTFTNDIEVVPEAENPLTEGIDLNALFQAADKEMGFDSINDVFANLDGN